MLNDSQRELVLNNMKLVTFTINKYMGSVSPNEFEDFIQVGYIGLCKAALYFDESKGVKFSTYAIPSIYRAIKRYKYETSQIKKPRDWGKFHAEADLENINFNTALDDEIMTKVCQKLKITERQYMALLPSFNFSDLMSFESLIEITEDTSSNVKNILEYENNALDISLQKVEVILKKEGLKRQDFINRFLDSISNAYYNKKLSCEEIEQKYGVSRQAYYKGIKLCKEKLAKHLEDGSLKELKDILYTNLSILDEENSIEFIC